MAVFGFNNIVRAILIVQLTILLMTIPLVVSSWRTQNESIMRGEEAHTAICIQIVQDKRDLKATDVFLTGPDVPEGARIYLERYQAGLQAEIDALAFLNCP